LHLSSRLSTILWIKDKESYMEVNYKLYEKLKDFMDRKGLTNLTSDQYTKAIRELVDILDL
jgi:hypothetical protein